MPPTTSYSFGDVVRVPLTLGLEKSVRTTTATKNRRLYRQLQSIDRLPKRDQQEFLRTIDAVLSRAS